MAAISALAAGAGFVGCSTYSGSTLGEQVESWASSASTGGPPFWSQVATVVTDARRVGLVEAGHDADAIRTDCVLLSDDTRAVYQFLPTPDPELTSALDAALSTEENAATDCFGGAGGGPQQARADRERAEAAGALTRARNLYVTLTAGVASGSS